MIPDNYKCEGQINIFDLFNNKEDFKFDTKNKKTRMIELFAGVGSQAMSLKELGIEFEHYKVVEFDKYAIASYNAIHGTDFPVLDVTKISGKDLGIEDKMHYNYILTYSFPCTDLSVAGKMLGMEEGSGTRSSLLWEVKRLLDECDELPQVLVMENVTQVHSADNMPSLRKWFDFLYKKGYTTFWQDMNAKDYGVAQSRNRTFAVSILGNYNYKFQEPIKLNKVIKDYLEPVVDDKYYLLNDKARNLVDGLIKERKILNNELTNERIGVDLCFTQSETVEIANAIARRYDAGICKHKYEHSGVCEISQVTTENIPSVLEKWIWNVNGVDYLIRIRRLTPKECWRLMDFKDEYFIKAEKAVSNSQLYKQAGNSIVKNCLVAIFGQMFEGKEDHYRRYENDV